MKLKLNISNNLSILRIILAIPLAYYLLNDNKVIVLLISGLAIISDYLDGYFARKMNQITDFGKVLDPIADKIFFGTAAIIMIFQGMIPLYLAVVIVSRDLLIFLGGIYIKHKTGIVVASNMTGKIAVNIAALVLIGILLNINGFYIYGSLITALFFIYSFVIYLLKGIKILKSK